MEVDTDTASYQNAEIQEVLDERTRNVGRGKRREYLVRWTRYEHPTWEPADNLDGTVALNGWLRSREKITLSVPRSIFDRGANTRRGA